MVNIDVCIDFNLLKVEVPLIFLGTGGFQLRIGRRSDTLFNYLVDWDY